VNYLKFLYFDDETAKAKNKKHEDLAWCPDARKQQNVSQFQSIHPDKHDTLKNFK
jgi:hypothetical protein